MKINKNYTILALSAIVFLFILGWVNYQPWPTFEPFTASLITADSESPEIPETPEIPGTFKGLVQEKIEQGKEFLYRMEHPEEHGFYKKYDAINDTFEERLHTVYSASIIYTFLYIYDYDRDEEILKHLSDWGDFLLSMQDKDKSSRRYGAFSYSYFLNSKEKEKKYVVGTSALSIFTLLRLYEITGQDKYLESAKLAGDWLITMQREDGVVKPYTRYSDGRWVFGKKESLLYNGQCLSALSKLYAVTKIQKYYNAAEKIAKHFTQKYEDAGRKYIVGEYRTKNPISNSWVVMSLMDFYRVSENDYYKDIVFELSSQVVSHQVEDGRIDGAYSTSGNGWISEVMTDTYRFCLEQERSDCEKYKETVVNIIRWLIQYTYSKENSSFLKNPERAIGGVYWNEENKYVRTDSVCHAINGYTRIMNFLQSE
ncbi:glycoside hydrolase family 88 protein [Patescibacteria group bacterium]|nr:glycoside hydrolase family 88 protein [Patescibacteria group bacterium]